MKLNNISIIGLGLIGGSLAKAFRQENKAFKIFAVDNCSEALKLAEADGVIDMGFNECCSEIWNSDIIFICTPIRKTMQFISQLADNVKDDCIITDVASTKHEICNYVDGLKNPPIFIGGHPMAGTEKSGYLNTFSHLFQNAYYVLTPSKTASKAALGTLEALLTGIGAIPIIVSPEKHDIVAGCISHVPHIIASALVTLAKNENDSELIKLLAAGGFRDITRIASSNPTMWENVVLSNSPVIVELLDKFKKIIDETADNISSFNNSEIYNFFDKAKSFRDSFSTTSVGLIPKSFELILDIEDEPGIIGKIATLLGDNEINLKNINVSNSREYEQGCLKITLSDQSNTDRAYKILSGYSYKVFRKE
ncbi:prephenate dehydrogenase [Ruminiclostridium sufflavum DSM 19573]|uniref:Prephenate dehydrogenase n=1 Tax=Ruminiclostridium sufflavum DSM 19573 TaxID=1121337 RepID=A0A318XPH0_9FIRM|nr:prephenate dehydrogenase [Ruminiclostridium sufflavum]PYG87992.1 prephenate dehydrogenase [Ruminiclostridium sufflavum DSM 19573]